MSIQVNKKNLPIETKDMHGITFFRPKFKKDWFVSGIDLCKFLGYEDPERQSWNFFKKYKQFIEESSVILELKRDIATPPALGGAANKKKSKKYSRYIPVRVYNEEDAIFLISRSKMPIADLFMRKFVNAALCLKDFVKSRIKTEKKSEWKTVREIGMTQRRSLTDAIQLLVEYAEFHGSKGYKHYFVLVTQKINWLLFDVKKTELPTNFRKTRSTKELMILGLAEIEIADFINISLDTGIEYKKIFQDLDEICLKHKKALQILTCKTLEHI